MARATVNSLASYVNCYPNAVRKSSAELGLLGLCFNEDRFDPFERNANGFKEIHICENIGERAARLKYIGENCKFEGTIGPNEFLVTPAGQPVQWHLRDKADALSIRLQPEFVNRIAEEELGMDPDRVELLHNVPVRDPFISSCGASLLKELRRGNLSDHLLVGYHATNLAMHLLCRYSARPSMKVDCSGRLSDSQKKAVEEYIRRNLGNPASLKLDELARRAGESKFRFHRLFKKSEGMPLHQYVITRRFEWAKQLVLKCRNMDLTEIAHKVGYSELSHMDKIFRERLDMSPTQLRESSG